MRLADAAEEPLLKEALLKAENRGFVKVSGVFPVRFLGFGLYWAWLFLVTLSPSPALGEISFAGVPSELLELGGRLLAVLGIMAISSKLSTPAGRKALLAVCCVVGPAATALFSAFHTGVLGLAALVLLAVVDASMFIVWLCFFGHMKVGETAIYMALSYCVGGVLCLTVQAVGHECAVSASVALPLLSGMAFHFSNKLYSGETGEAELFSSEGKGVEDTEAGPHAYLRRLGVALGGAAFVFGSVSSSLFFGFSFSYAPGALIESACCVVLLLVCCAIVMATKQAQDLCLLYKVVPTLFAVGAVLLLCGIGEVSGTAGAAFVNLAYLTFEVTALNDFCTAAKSRSLSLVRTFCAARGVITAGMLLGWCVSACAAAASYEHALALSVGPALVVAVLCATVVFTEKEIYAARNVAVFQEKFDNMETAALSKDEVLSLQLEAFSESFRLTNRESEVAALMLQGRNARYIAEKLFISQNTVKTHAHKIYSKLGVHNRMELLDSFEEFRRNVYR